MTSRRGRSAATATVWSLHLERAEADRVVEPRARAPASRGPRRGSASSRPPSSRSSPGSARASQTASGGTGMKRSFVATRGPYPPDRGVDTQRRSRSSASAVRAAAPARRAVDRAAGERGGAAEVQPAHRRAIRRQARDRAEDQLVERVGARPHVAVHEVGVAPLELGGRQDVAGEDQVAEAGRERSTWRSIALDVRAGLALPVGVVRPVRVGPGGVPAGRRARGVRDRLLAEEQERALGEPAARRARAPRASRPPRRRRARCPPPRASGAVHGTGPESAQSTLSVEGP